MLGENVSSADNQQERLELYGWLTGFTDGEGAFTVSILKNLTSKTGWQVFPEFIVTQGAKSKTQVLRILTYYMSDFCKRRRDSSVCMATCRSSNKGS